MFQWRALAFLATVATTTTAAASGFFGTTLCGSAPMDGATIRALDNDTQSSADLTTSDVAGDYLLSLPNGVYDLVVTPPAGSPCVEATIQNKTVSGDTHYNIVLVAQEPPPPGQITLSGHVTVDGVPTPNIEVWLRLPGMRGGQIPSTADADGYYSITVPAGTYRVNPFGDLPATGTFPRYFECNTHDTNYTTSAVIDFDGSTAGLTGSVVGATTGNGAPGVSVRMTNFFYSAAYDCIASAQVTTASDGTFGPIYGLAGATGYVQSTAISGVYGSARHDLLMPAHGDSIDVPLVVSEILNWKVSGHLRLADGTPIPGVGTRLIAGFGDTAASSSTAADGSYEMTVPQGTYFLLLDYGDGAKPGLPWQLECYAQDFLVDRARTKDFVVPLGTVRGTLTYTGTGLPVAGSTARVQTTFDVPDGGLCRSWEALSTGADGAFGPSIQVAPGSGKVEIAARQGVHDAAAQTFTAAAAGADTVVDLSVVGVVNHSIHGTFTGEGAVPFGGAWIRVFGRDGFSPLGETFTAADGSYAITVPAGTYRVIMDKDGQPDVPDHVSCWRNDVVVDGATTLDVAADWVEVTGRAATSAGVPVAGVTAVGTSMHSDGTGGCQTYDERDVTDANGDYRLRLTPGNASFTYQPPPGSGFSAPSGIAVPLSGDLVQDVVLPLPDHVAPAFVGDPLVIHHSDRSVSIQWRTNEATNGRVEYRVGPVLDAAAAAVDTTPYVTSHIVTLRGLAATTLYSYRITARDRGGNPVVSAPLTFTTLGERDGDPPVIVAPPEVTYLAPTQLRVTWETDEPATSQVTYGLPGQPPIGAVDGDDAAIVHSVLVTGLTPGTTYALTVASTDPDDNGPTTAALGETTPTGSDHAPPVLGELAAACVSESTIGFCWESDEPATSDLTYTDLGSGAVVALSSDSLVTTHCLTLTQLAAGATYRIAVASSDGAGNGASAGPFDVTTLDGLSASRPVVSALVAHYASPTSAWVTWTTNVPASSVVRYGAAPDALSSLAGDGGASATDHAVLVNGLVAGATVYVAVASTDACGGMSDGAALRVSDVDECAADNGGCEAGCENFDGGFRCTCPEGFELQGDGTSCRELGSCPTGASVSCSQATPLVFFGVVSDRAGVPYGSIRCTRAVDGAVTCDNVAGELVVTRTLWCH